MKQYLTFAVAFVALSGAAFAAPEPPVSGTAGAGSSVIVPLTLTVLDDLNMPQMVRDELKCVSPYDPNEPNTAEFYVTGDEGDAVLFTVPSTITLAWDPNSNGASSVDGENDQDIVVTTITALKHFEKQYGPPPPIDLTVQNPHPLSTQFQDGSGAEGGPAHGAPATADGMGQMYVYVGGCAQASSAQQRGTYTGSVSLTVSYQ